MTSGGSSGLRAFKAIERIFWIVLLMATASLGALALDRDRSIAQFHSTFWSEKDGAPGDIGALAQTNDGYLWIGSTRGLFRFDGVKFDEYQPPAGVELPSHSIWSLMAMPDGGLWIAFEPNGVGFLKDGSLTVFTRRDQLPPSPIHCFARDDDGTIWAATETGLVFRQNDRWIPLSAEWNLPPEMIRYMFVDRAGTLWVATINRIFYRKRDAKRFERGGPVGSAVTTLSQASDGRVWLADDGIFQVRPAPTSEHDLDPTAPFIAADGLRELLFDKDGSLWITRGDSGIVRIRDPGKLEARRYGEKDPEFESFGPKQGFPAGYAYKLLEDREGNVWVGCSNGLIRFRHNHVVPIALPEGYMSLTLSAGAEGALWVGTISNNPVLKIHGDSMVPASGGDVAASVLHEANGDVWWGSRAGVWRQRDSKFTWFPLSKDAVPQAMWDLMPTEDKHGLWVKLGDDGLVRFNQGRWNLHDWPRGVPKVGGTFRYGPSASFRDASGRYWLGYTSGQIYLVDKGQPTEYSRRDGLDVGRIKVIRGQEDRVWAGGEVGLEFFSKGRFWKVQTADGQPFGAVSGIIETPDSGLWLNEMRGIIQIPQEEVRQVLADPSYRVTCNRFDYMDGLPGSPQMAYTSSTATRTTDGLLWFATGNGLARVDPMHMAKNLIPPPVSILAISSERGGKLPSSHVQFAAGTHTIEIDYTGLSLSVPERVKFRYRLEPVDAEWQDVGARRQAFYSNLGPGTFRFRVIACNNDGVWNTEGARMQFTIAPTWYQTEWFRLLWIISACLLLILTYRVRVRSISKAMSVRFDERLDERTRMARELHDTFLQTVQGSKIVADDALASGTDEERMRRALEKLSGWLGQAVSEGRTALHALRVSTTEKNELAEFLERTVKEQCLDANLSVATTVVGDARNLHPIVRDEVSLIAREAIHNACIHSRGSQLRVELGYAEDLRLRIRDNGVGIDPDVLDAGKKGHFGLRGMRERSARIRAKLTISSSRNHGTEVTLKIPGDVAYLSEKRNRMAHMTALFSKWRSKRDRDTAD
jgi:ligand-binding sensor domain-containing protein